MVTCLSAFNSIVQQHDTIQRLHVAKNPLLSKKIQWDGLRKKQDKASSHSWSRKTRMMS